MSQGSKGNSEDNLAELVKKLQEQNFQQKHRINSLKVKIQEIVLEKTKMHQKMDEVLHENQKLCLDRLNSEYQWKRKECEYQVLLQQKQQFNDILFAELKKFSVVKYTELKKQEQRCIDVLQQVIKDEGSGQIISKTEKKDDVKQDCDEDETMDASDTSDKKK